MSLDIRKWFRMRSETKELVRELLQAYALALPPLIPAFVGLNSAFDVSYHFNRWILFFGGYLASILMGILTAMVADYLIQRGQKG